MSRTFKKFIRYGICGGKNTEFYRERNRKLRHVNKEHLREMINDEDLDGITFDDNYKKDDWTEPTDGSFLVNEDTIKRDIRENGENFFTKAVRYLKSMRPWNRGKTKNYVCKEDRN